MIYTLDISSMLGLLSNMRFLAWVEFDEACVSSHDFEHDVYDPKLCEKHTIWEILSEELFISYLQMI